jgi:predicted dehydrogenase
MPKAHRTIRVGIVGTGQIGRRHLSAYAKMSGATVIACADIDQAVARASADAFGVPNVHTDYREMLRRDDIDAVDVCLHNNLHAPVTVAALEAGKHVLCEKPIAGSYRDANAMIEASRKTGRMLHIQLPTLFSNETRAAKELIGLGELGEIYHARSTGHRRRGRPFVDGGGSPAFVQKRHAAGGAVYDMGAHHIAQILYLIGNPAVVRVSGKTYQKIEMDPKRRAASGYDVEELGLGFVRCAGGISIDIIESWAMHIDRIDGPIVVGSRGGVRLRPFGFFRSFGDIDVNATADLPSARRRWHTVRDDGDGMSTSQRHWIAALQGTVPLLPTAEIALTTMLISEAIYLSDKRGEEVTAEEVIRSSVSTPAP